MKIEIQIDENLKEPKVLISTNEMSDSIKKIIEYLNNLNPIGINAYRNNLLEILDQNSIYYIEANLNSVYLYTEKDEYVCKYRLYELETILDTNKFVRISKSQIVNLKKVKYFDLNLVQTICVNLINGKKLYVSRRYLKLLKEKLKI